MSESQVQRYFMVLDYNGLSFHGWQIQPNAVTIQGEINHALSTILREDINVVGAGRTDTGVSARNFVAHFDSSKTAEFDLAHLSFRLNRFLPKQIVIKRIVPVSKDAHTRFDATARTYNYCIHLYKDAFDYPFSTYIHQELNVELMNEAAQRLFDYTDFTSFSKVDTDTKTNLCEMMYAQWKLEGHKLTFTITANRFLRNMVRAIVGTLLEVGYGKMTIDEFCKVIEAKDRNVAGTSAPAGGLFLEEITYPYTF